MTDCKFCHRPILKGQETNPEGNHAVCGAEFDDRINKGLCAVCGKNKRNKPSAACIDCLANESGFSGYEGHAS